MPSKEDLKAAVSEYKQKLASDEEDQVQLVRRLEAEATEFGQMVSKWLYLVDEDLKTSVATESVTGPRGKLIELKSIHIEILNRTISISAELRNDAVTYPLTGLGDKERPNVVRKEDQVWKVLRANDGTYVSHFNEDYLIDRLIRLLKP
ncbi:hypothetical protein PSEUDO8Z_160311 [Pseudomonas sp. 8Z]|uniref:hypothetical protein n=1 Tax=Pseudomonas sp. 8Z TaxID=2653166 RepID=UPI0012EFDD8E|nr:hypothetical protein [Pseudomonas sp. 8Z]VXC71578.1 hypothetical protein PSEUDO8Z_160311 [Pseudomonas sp. 8Z]